MDSSDGCNDGRRLSVLHIGKGSWRFHILREWVYSDVVRGFARAVDFRTVTVICEYPHMLVYGLISEPILKSDTIRRAHNRNIGEDITNPSGNYMAPAKYDSRRVIISVSIL